MEGAAGGPFKPQRRCFRAARSHPIFGVRTMSSASVGPRGNTASAGLPSDSLGTALAEVIADLLGRAASESPSRAISVVDCGGGSGTLAVPIAALGATVTVVDSSIDALAILERRAQEAGVSDNVRAVQGDVEDLADLILERSADLVLVHGVVTSVTQGTAGLKAAALAVKVGGFLSVVVANAAAGVLSRALNGDLLGARTELLVHEPVIDLHWLTGLVESFGFTVVVAQGLGAFSSTVPGSVINPANRSDEVIADLDRLAATRAPYRDIAGRLHLIARRAQSGPAPVLKSGAERGS
ncbi:MAG: SAM-dependent methyltransferase [Pseudonocardiales bacterium]|nr:SAM-dependent methyltransferase [Pseudonocardiales bacterium]